MRVAHEHELNMGHAPKLPRGQGYYNLMCTYLGTYASFLQPEALSFLHGYVCTVTCTNIVYVPDDVPMLTCTSDVSCPRVIGGVYA